MKRGEQLIAECKEHLLLTMRDLPECEARVGGGAGNKMIETEADFQLELTGHDQYFTWSLLMSLVQDRRIEVVPGTERRKKFRLL